MINLFLYLFIGHLIGDFLLQTSKLVAFKQSSIIGLLLHITIVILATLIVMLPYFSVQLIIILFTLFVLHFTIDKIKILYEQCHKKLSIALLFWLDQIAHIFSLFLVLLLVPNNFQPIYFTETWWFEYYQKTDLLIYIAGILLFSYSVDIIYFINRLNKGDHTPYIRSYYSMLFHTFIFVACFLITWLIIKLS